MIRPRPIQRLFTKRHPATNPADAANKLVEFGMNALDQRIGGGLMRGALHEFFAASIQDGSTTAAFTAMVAMRVRPVGRPVIWVRERQYASNMGHIYTAGIAELGLNPADLIMVDTTDTLSVLRASADIVKCGQIGAAVIELCGKASRLDLTASRRLSIAAAASGVMTLLLRVDAQPIASAAHTRWQVAAAPSSPLASNAPGNPAFDIALLRHRGGIAGFEMRLEWNRDTRSFAPLSGGVPAIPAFGTDQTRPDDQRRAA